MIVCLKGRPVMPRNRFKPRKRKSKLRKPPLTVKKILAWADDHRERTGSWPTVYCGEVLAAPNEKWPNIDQCLRRGLRSLPGGDTLCQLLVRERGHRSPTSPPDLTEDQIAVWALNHRQKTGNWPTQSSGPVDGQPGEVWGHLSPPLRVGQRGLPGGDSLARLLERRYGVRTLAHCPPLTEEQLVVWADEHRQRT